MTWGKIASWGVAAAMTAASGLAAPPAPAVASALAGAEPLAGYTPISTGQGMCLDATDGPGPGCVTVAPVRGPGALIMAWFGRQAS